MSARCRSSGSILVRSGGLVKYRMTEKLVEQAAMLLIIC